MTARKHVIMRLLLPGFVFLLSCTCGFSQGLYNETNLYIGGTTVFVEGDVHNDGLLVNDGQLSFTTDWTSKGKYKGSGIVEANGDGTQRIFHDNQKISRFYINGWGTKYIQGRINITDLLRLTTGIVQVSPEDRLQLDHNTVIEGGSSDSHIEGALAVKGTGYKFFPLGKNGTYAPIEFLDVKGKSPEFSVEVFEDGQPISVDNVIVRNSFYWQRTDQAGDFHGSPVGIEYEPEHFIDAAMITMLAGNDWESPFMTITELDHSSETHKVSSHIPIVAPIIMLGEISSQWREADFYFSTALSPNAVNSDNRKIKIFGERLSEDQFRFVVFDRWGSLVFESTSLESMATSGWDGRSKNGQELVSGTYPYRLSAFDKTGKPFEKKGVITIIY